MSLDPEIIVERSRTSEGAKYNPYVTAEEIAEWQKAEISGIARESQAPVFLITDPRKSGMLLWKAARTALFH